MIINQSIILPGKGKTMLNILNKLVCQLKSTNSNNAKLEIIKKMDKSLYELFIYIHSPYIKFGVTSKLIKEKSHLSETNIYSLMELLSLLSEKTLTGHSAISAINGFISRNIEYEDLILKIIDKDLQCRISSSIINKAIPNLIPEFNIALGKDIREYYDKLKIENGYCISRKMNGVRLIIQTDELGEPTYFSREGRKFTCFGNLTKIIKKLNIPNRVIDCESCVINDDGTDNFKQAVREIKLKDHTILKPRIFIFDYLTIEEFNSKKSKRILSERFDELQKLKSKWEKFEEIKILEQNKAIDLDHVNLIYNDYIKRGYEGIILRRDTIYNGKKSWDILKYKPVEQAEFKVLSVEFGPVDDGYSNKVMGLTRVYVEGNINGEVVRSGVGSGFSFDERILYYEKPELIQDKLITVDYTFLSEDDKGNKSLQFARFKTIRDYE